MIHRLTLAIAAATLLAACGGYGASNSYMAPAPGNGNTAPASSSPAVTQTILGSPGFATPSGMTLYVFSADGMGVSNCSGACAGIWPPFMAASGAQSSGNFSVITRSDGSRQWAYKSHPLYTFSGDTTSGQASGQGINHFGGTFTVARP